MLRILLVDDNPLVRKTIRRTLADHSVDEAESGRAGLLALDRGSYDVVISDVMMPDGDGVAFYEAARRRDPRWARRFIFLTGGSGAAVQRRLSRVQGPQVLEKPVTLQQLWAAVQAAADAE